MFANLFRGGWKRSRLLQYGFAVGLVGLSTLAQALIDPYIGDGAPYVVFFLANAIVIRYAGTAPSILAIILSILCADFFFLDPRYSLRLTAHQALISGAFVSANGVMLLLSMDLKRTARELKRTIEKLHTHQETLEAVLNGATNAQLAYLDRDFRFIRVNDAYAKGCGYCEAELIGKNHFDLFPNEENERIFKRVRDTGQPVEYHDKPFAYVHDPKRGMTYWDWTLTPVRQRSGDVVGVVLSLFETTRSKLAEIDLRESEERLRRSEYRYAAAQRAARIGSWDCNLDTREMEWSEHIEAMFGFAAGAFGKTCDEFLNLIHPDDRELVKTTMDAAAAGGTDYRLEHRVVRPDGAVRWVYQAGKAQVTADASARMLFGIVQDITERKIAEETLQVQAAALQAAANAIVITARNGTIEWVNPAFEKLTGYSSREVVGRNPRLLKSSMHSPEFYKQLWKTILEGGVWRGEVVNRRKDGSYYTEEMTITPVQGNDERVAHFIGIKQDVSDRKKAEAELREAQAKLRRYAADLEKAVAERTGRLQELVADLEHFSYTLSHDLRAPLRAIRGYTDLLLESGGIGEGDQALFLSKIAGGTDRMDCLIRDALEFSRAVRSELRLNPIDLGALLGNMLRTHPHLQSQRDAIRVEGEFPQVLGNETALTQSLDNLLGNALKYIPPGAIPRVIIRAEETPLHRVRVWIEDNGIGIDAEELPKIFQLFHRVSREYEGTGIGLALVKKNVERMGGAVGVESEPGKGSRFWIELKKAEPPSATGLDAGL